MDKRCELEVWKMRIEQRFKDIESSKEGLIAAILMIGMIFGGWLVLLTVALFHRG